MNTGKCILKIFENNSKLIILANTITRSYAFKSDLQIKWVRPNKVPCYKAAVSGDLQRMPSMDTKQFQMEFRNCKELENASELVQRLFTLEFGPHCKTVQSYVNDMLKGVQRHPLDRGSIESKIARWTGIIRAMQEIMEEYPRNKRLKVNLKELIDKRKKHLKYLRRWDYKRFEWLLENLNIVYKASPSEFHWVTRKDSLRKLTQKYCDEVVNNKLSAYKLALREEQPAFLSEKIKLLQFIRDEQESCGTKVTITEEDIKIIQQQLSDLLKQNENIVKED